MTWFQYAFDENAPHGRQWVVLRMWWCSARKILSCTEISRWPTKHEAEGHARKELERMS